MEIKTYPSTTISPIKKYIPVRILDVIALTSTNVGTQHVLVLCKYHVKVNTLKIKPPFFILSLIIKWKTILLSKLVTDENDANDTWTKKKSYIIQSEVKNKQLDPEK